MQSSYSDKKILGVDPGVASGGAVLIKSNNTIISARSLVEKKNDKNKANESSKKILDSMDGWGDREFYSLVLRSHNWINRFKEYYKEMVNEHGAIDYIVIESFVDQRSRAREEKKQLLINRWHTPFLMGELTYLLKKEEYVVGENIIFQNAGIVIRQWKNELDLLSSRKKLDRSDIVVKNDNIIRNDHLRKALIHALAFSLRLKDQEIKRRENNEN